MRATIEFNLDEERGKLLQFFKFDDYETEAFDLYNEVRGYLKHEEDNIEKAHDLLEKCKYFCGKIHYGEDF